MGNLRHNCSVCKWSKNQSKLRKIELERAAMIIKSLCGFYFVIDISKFILLKMEKEYDDIPLIITEKEI